MNKFEQYNYLFKYIVVGDSNVGKSCLISQFTEGKFSAEMDTTIGVEFGCRTINQLDQSIKLQIWDTAGQESYKSITRSYYRGSIGGVLVYDITRRQSFENIKRWLEDIKTHSCEQIVLVLVGNKSDMDSNREVTLQEGLDYAKSENIEFFESSAKSGKNVELIFERVSYKILMKIDTKEIDLDSNVYGIKVCKNVSKTKKPKKDTAIPFYELTTNVEKNQDSEVEKGKEDSCC